MTDLPSQGICVFAAGLPSSIAEVALPGHLLPQTYLDRASLHKPKRILAVFNSINTGELTSID
jgi:hypothetical protein